ncbi:MAG: hypothetical protein Q9163_003755 [Psora crenata]
MASAVQYPDTFALEAAAAAVSTVVRSLAAPRHCFIGGYAVSLLGGTRSTHLTGKDVDVLVAADPSDIRLALIKADPKFSLTPANKLVYAAESYTGQDGPPVIIELLRGGLNQQLKLPDANSVVTLDIATEIALKQKISIPIVHPSVLVLTKIKRWMFIAESTRPASKSKANHDLTDIRVILRWLAERKIRIDFTAYPEQPKDRFLPGLRMLYARDTEAQGLLDVTMEEEDLASVKV